jgi:hypothetical protein
MDDAESLALLRLLAGSSDGGPGDELFEAASLLPPGGPAPPDFRSTSDWPSRGGVNGDATAALIEDDIAQAHTALSRFMDGGGCAAAEARGGGGGGGGGGGRCTVGAHALNPPPPPPLHVPSQARWAAGMAHVQPPQPQEAAAVAAAGVWWCRRSAASKSWRSWRRNAAAGGGSPAHGSWRTCNQWAARVGPQPHPP